MIAECLLGVEIQPIDRPAQQAPAGIRVIQVLLGHKKLEGPPCALAKDTQCVPQGDKRGPLERRHAPRDNGGFPELVPSILRHTSREGLPGVRSASPE